VGIDGAVDGIAYGVRGIGGKVRGLQTGRVQLYIGLAVALLFVLLGIMIMGS